MDKRILGIHHVTMIAGEPQPNIDFYAGVLGLRLVKLTVNFDDNGRYHLYYGDDLGHPGTLLTFFAWPGASRGRVGTGQTTAVALSIPTHSLGYWIERLIAHGVEYTGPDKRFGDQVLSFRDPDGLALELVAGRSEDRRTGWVDGPVPGGHAIRGVHSVTLMEEERQPTAQLLTKTIGFRPIGEEGNRVRFGADDGAPGALVDVVAAPGFRHGVVAVGTVHHVAWRTPNDEQEIEWREEISREGYDVTPVRDRTYFHSIYFDEPGGVLFEIATDNPGFTVDEPAAELGTHLLLPPWLEPRRAEIEAVLPAVRLPNAPAAEQRP